MFKKILIYGGIAVILLALLIQLIPYGHDHTNPPVIKEPSWDSPQTQALFQRACADCHSNNTQWAWYTNIAPFSWLIQHDVEDGRAHLNLSECGVPRAEGEGEERDEIGEVILEGEMPPPQYTLIHGEARLTHAERQALADGILNSPCQ